MSDKELTIKLTQLANRLRHVVTNNLPRMAGKMAVDFIKQSFHNEGFTDTTIEKWPEVKHRQNPLVLGARASRKILKVLPILRTTG